jgi:hypothetical protein
VVDDLDGDAAGTRCRTPAAAKPKHRSAMPLRLGIVTKILRLGYSNHQISLLFYSRLMNIYFAERCGHWPRGTSCPVHCMVNRQLFHSTPQ